MEVRFDYNRTGKMTRPTCIFSTLVRSLIVPECAKL